MFGKSTDSRRRPTQQASPVSFNPIMAPQTRKNAKNVGFSAVRCFLPYSLKKLNFQAQPLQRLGSCIGAPRPAAVRLPNRRPSAASRGGGCARSRLDHSLQIRSETMANVITPQIHSQKMHLTRENAKQGGRQALGPVLGPWNT